jgi:hypothetical protein
MQKSRVRWLGHYLSKKFILIFVNDHIEVLKIRAPWCRAMLVFVSPYVRFRPSTLMDRKCWRIYKELGFSPTHDLAPSSSPLSRQKAVSFLFPVFLHICHRLSLLTGEVIRRRESLVLCKSFNTLFLGRLNAEQYRWGEWRDIARETTKIVNEYGTVNLSTVLQYLWHHRLYHAALLSPAH